MSENKNLFKPLLITIIVALVGFLGGAVENVYKWNGEMFVFEKSF